MEQHMIDSVTLANGEQVSLDEFPCNHCGKIGSPYMAVSDQGAWAFCSWGCRQQALKVNGEGLTPSSQEAAGIHFIDPSPVA